MANPMEEKGCRGGEKGRRICRRFLYVYAHTYVCISQTYVEQQQQYVEEGEYSYVYICDS